MGKGAQFARYFLGDFVFRSHDYVRHEHLAIEGQVADPCFSSSSFSNAAGLTVGVRPLDISVVPLKKGPLQFVFPYMRMWRNWQTR